MTSPTASAQTDAEEPVGDIVKLILADHTRIRRLLDALDDPAGQRAPGGARSRPPLAWRKLDTLLGLHLQAEEIFIHPQAKYRPSAQLPITKPSGPRPAKPACTRQPHQPGGGPSAPSSG
jgi:hypothetical protein